MKTIKIYQVSSLSSIKFIPASGAATRMFKDLYAYMDSQVETDFVDNFFASLEDFAFYGKLRQYIDVDSLNKDIVKDRLLLGYVLLCYNLLYFYIAINNTN